MGSALLFFVLGCLATIAIVAGSKSRSNSSHKAEQKFLAKDTVEALDEETGEIVEISTRQTNPSSVEGKLICFKYLDAMQHGSSRTLLCWNCWTSQHLLYIRGYCLMRNALRTFRADRMSDVTDGHTGAAIDSGYFIQRAELEARDAFGNHFEDNDGHSIFANRAQEKTSLAAHGQTEGVINHTQPFALKTRIPFGRRHGIQTDCSIAAERGSVEFDPVLQRK